MTSRSIAGRTVGAPASRSARPAVAICGSGNAGHALAVALSHFGRADVYWLAGSAEKAAALRARAFAGDGLRSTGQLHAAADRVRVISADPADVIPRANVVVLATPAYAHAQTLRAIHGYLRDDAWIGAMPSRSGFEFEARASLAGVEPAGRRCVFGLQTLPWATRVVDAGSLVRFRATKARVLLAAQPAHMASTIARKLARLTGVTMVPTGGFLNLTLGNQGQVLHPCLMYGHFAQWSGRRYAKAERPDFYLDASDATVRVVERVSAEIVALAAEIERRSGGALALRGVPTTLEWLRFSYGHLTRDTSSVATCFRTGPLRESFSGMIAVDDDAFVPNFGYRYLTEDVPYGLVVVRAIAQLAGVPMPHVDTVLRWTQERLGVHYFRADGTIGGADTAALPIPQNYGVETFGDLVAWYAGDGVAERGMLPAGASATLAAG